MLHEGVLATWCTCLSMHGQGNGRFPCFSPFLFFPLPLLNRSTSDGRLQGGSTSWAVA